MPNRKKIRATPKSGFTLVEAMVAIFVVTVGTIGALGLITQSISFGRTSSNQAIAVYLAQEGVELIRNIRDTNFLTAPAVPWDKDLTACSDGCEIDYNDTVPTSFADKKLLINSGGFYNYDTGSEETLFKRKITITKPPAGLMEVRVEVFWEEKGVSNSVEVETELYDWDD